MKILLLLAVTMATACAEPVPMTFTSADGTEVLYRFAAPEKTEEEKSYPLILFLHGSGQRGTDNKAQLKHSVADILKGAAELKKPVYLIAPQCPPGRWWSEPAPGWLTLKNAGGKDPLMDAVLALVQDTAGKYPIDRKRIYITGNSMGGFGTWDMLARSPQTWAAAIPVCGGGDPKTAWKFKDVPIRIFHGDPDDVVPTKSSQLMADALRKAGSKAELTLYPGVGHNSWTPTFQNPEVIKWLFAQRKPD
jgi:predicted peptidase